MKTADLIPLILLELNENDKYGFELTKAIETKSNGKIVIKQPTLYTLLKKLEKSKFITSYWEDSDIGGKRHYYKLTQNGKLQVSTLPSYEFLMASALSGDENTETNLEKTTTSTNDILASTPSPSETIIPSSEVFSENNLDNATEFEINSENTNILKDDKISSDEQFATNENVSSFTAKIPQNNREVNNNIISETSNSSDFLDVDFIVPKNENDIKFIDYVDFKNKDSYKSAKVLTNKMMLKILSTSASLVLMILLCSIITSFTGRSGLYYFFFIGAILTTIFYPILYIINMDRMRLKFEDKPYKHKIKLKLIISVAITLLVVIICVVFNIKVYNNSLGKIFNIKNFCNMYAPILLVSTYYLDILFTHIFTKNLKK